MTYSGTEAPMTLNLFAPRKAKMSQFGPGVWLVGGGVGDFTL